MAQWTTCITDNWVDKESHNSSWKEIAQKEIVCILCNGDSGQLASRRTGLRKTQNSLSLPNMTVHCNCETIVLYDSDRIMKHKFYCTF